MERKKLVYNVIQDIWRVVNMPIATKSGNDMTDDDWTDLISAIEKSAKKYKKLGPIEEDFYGKVSIAFLDLVEHECKTLV